MGVGIIPANQAKYKSRIGWLEEGHTTIGSSRVNNKTIPSPFTRGFRGDSAPDVALQSLEPRTLRGLLFIFSFFYRKYITWISNTTQVQYGK